MKIYDMHVHIDRRGCDRQKLFERMDEAGVYGASLFSLPTEDSTAPFEKAPYRERLKSLKEWTDGEERLIPVLWVSPFEKNAADMVRDAAEEGVRAFKIMCDTFPVYCDESMRLLETIEETGRPAIFHSGILWSGTDTSVNNRPVNWEALMDLHKLKFSMGHCSWPWHDECIAVYGKFLNSYLTRRLSAEMFFDLTPGTPPIYRRELLTKLFTVGYDVENNLMFGTDSVAADYDPDWVTGWIARDNGIYDELGVTEKQREKIYRENFMRFLSGGDTDHRAPMMNKNS